MLGRLKKYIRDISNKIAVSVIPELKYLFDDRFTNLFDKNTSFNSIRSYSSNSLVNNLAKLYPPFGLYDSSINKYTYISANSNISNASIGKFCSIGPNFLCGWGIHPINGISTSPMFYSTKNQNGTTLSKVDKVEERKPIKIGNDVFIGANVTVLDGITIGDGAVIGAGAVVSKDIPPYAVAVGCPVQVIKYRFDEPAIESLLNIKWWEFEDEKLVDVEKMFFQVDEFIQKYGAEKE